MLKKILSLSVLLLTLSSCGGGSSGSGNSNGGNTSNVANAITIDNAGILPVIGNNTTTSLIYIHNNNNTTIRGISYTTKTNNSQSQSLSLSLKNKLKSMLGFSDNLVSQSSAGACSSIAAFQSCPLSITTPAGSNQGSILITANYIANGQAKTFSNVVSYSGIYNNPANGAIIAGGVQLNSFGNTNGYATIYIYGSGQNNIYTVNSLGVNKPAVVINQGNISGMQIQSNYVQAVELTAPAVDSGYTAVLTATSSLNSQNFMSSQSVGVTPSTNGAILTTGQVPLINSAASNPGGTLYVVNSGNESAMAISTSFDSGINPNSDGCNGQTLIPGGSCTVTFSVSQSSGSGNITLNYSGGSSSSVVQNVTWYNGSGGIVLQMSANPSPMIFNATVGESAVVTVTNIGGYKLTNLSVPAPTVISGGAIANIIDDHCSGESLNIGASCNYAVSLSDSATDISAQVNLYISGNYNNGTPQVYNRSLPLTYTSNAYTAVLSITPNPVSLTTTGDGIQTQTQTIVISNNGATTATSVAPGALSPPLSVTGNCNNPLTVGESCSQVITLGPATTATIESGSENYTVIYSGGQASGAIASDTINWIIQPDNQALAIESVIAAGTDISGSGESSDDAYIYPGYATTPGNVTLIVQNSGTNPVKITGIQDTVSSFAWLLSTIGSTCYGLVNSGESLAAGDTCTLVYTNQLSANASLINGGIGAIFNENITAPFITFQDVAVTPTQFTLQPGLPNQYSNNTVYATGKQATLVNAVSIQYIGSNIESVTISNSLANATGYGNNIVFTTTMEDYFTGAPESSGGCSAISESGTMIQKCNLSVSGSTAIGTLSYNVNNSLQNESLALHTLFSLSSGGTTVSISPLSSTTDLGIYVPLTLNVYLSSTSESLNLIESLTPNTVFYIYYQLSGGYAGQTFNYTPTFNNTPLTTCNLVSGSQTICYIPVNSGTNGGSQPIYYGDSSGGLTPTPESSSIIVNLPNIYFGTSAGTVYQNTTLLTGSGSMPLPGGFIGALALANNNIYTAGSSSGYVWMTTGGESWQVYGGEHIPGTGSNNQINVLAATGSFVFAGTGSGVNNVWFATSSSSGWESIGNIPYPYPSPSSPQDIIVLAISGENLYAAGDLGYVSVANITNPSSAMWESVCNNTLSTNPQPQVTSIAVNSDGTVFTSDTQGTVWQCVANGTVWEITNGGAIPGEDSNTVSAITLYNGNLYAGTNDGIVWESQSGNWQSICGGINPDGNENSLVVNANGIYVGAANNVTGASDIWYCANIGSNWVQESGSGIYGNLDNGTNGTLLAESGGNIYAGSGGGNVFVQTTPGSAWSGVVTGSLDNSSVQTTAVTTGNIYAGTYNGNVWMYSNSTWSQLTGAGYLGSLDGIYSQISSVNSIVLSESILYAGTSNGNVWHYANSSWTQDSGSGSGGSLDNSAVQSLANAGGNIYAGTANGNVWLLSGGIWIQESASGVDGSLNGPVTSLAASGSDLYAGNGAGRLWLLSAGVWVEQPAHRSGITDNSALNSVSVSGSDVYTGTYLGYMWVFNGGNWTTDAGSGPALKLDGSGIFSVVATDIAIYAGTGKGNVWTQPGNNQLWTIYYSVPDFSINSITVGQ